MHHRPDTSTLEPSSDGDEDDTPHQSATFGAKPLVAPLDDEDLSAHPGLATHTFRIVEDELGGEQEVITGAANSDSDLARTQLRTIVDTLITEQVSDPTVEGEVTTVTVEDGGKGGAPVKVCPHVNVPDRGLVSIQQLVSELNHVRPGAKLSKDRLTRVTQGSGAPEQRTILQVSTCTVVRLVHAPVHTLMAIAHVHTNCGSSCVFTSTTPGPVA